MFEMLKEKMREKHMCPLPYSPLVPNKQPWPPQKLNCPLRFTPVGPSDTGL